MKDVTVTGAQPRSDDPTLTHRVAPSGLNLTLNPIARANMDGTSKAFVANAIGNLEGHDPPQTAVVRIGCPGGREVQVTFPDPSKGSRNEQAAALIRALDSAGLSVAERAAVAGMIRDLTSQTTGHADVTRAGWVINVNR